MPNIIETAVNFTAGTAAVAGSVAAIVTGATSAGLKKSNAELKKEVANLITKNSELIIEKEELKAQIKTMRDQMENPLVYSKEDGLYYSADDTDKQRPYCPACYETKKKEIHLLPRSLKCPGCGTSYYTPKPSDIKTGGPRSSGSMFDGY
jgi:hypothetical protein